MDEQQSATELTLEFLQEQIDRAAYCASATVPGDQFSKILNLAMRNKAFPISGLARLMDKRHQDTVELSGEHLRLLLMLAINAHPHKRRPKSRISK
jgi:hypothetical protein